MTNHVLTSKIFNHLTEACAYSFKIEENNSIITYVVNGQIMYQKFSKHNIINTLLNFFDGNLPIGTSGDLGIPVLVEMDQDEPQFVCRRDW